MFSSNIGKILTDQSRFSRAEANPPIALSFDCNKSHRRCVYCFPDIYDK